jgi:hypothetical protein
MGMTMRGQRGVRQFSVDYLALGPATAGGPERGEALLRTLLTNGGDERIWPEPASGRNRYGTPPSPAPDEAWYSSSTASAITPGAFAVAGRALERLLGTHNGATLPIDAWLCEVRRELIALFATADSEVVFTPSGTEAEPIALAIAERLMGQRTGGAISNVIIAPGETGNGVPLAAAGRCFLSSSSLGGGGACAGRRLRGWEDADIEVASVEIRTPGGEPRAPEHVDRDAEAAVEQALARGRGVLLHVLDASKTGLAGVSRAMARHCARRAPERVLIVVDACQLRCPPAQVRDDLHEGFLVLVTGSKFAAGPPFSGALFLPGGIVDRLARAAPLPAGFASFSAQLDWPEPLQAGLADGLPFANVGLGLRWTAALAELKALAAVDASLQAAILARFSAEVKERARAVAFAALSDDAGRSLPSIVPLIVRDRCGRVASLGEAQKIHVLLRSPTPLAAAAAPALRRILHVGEPVGIGASAALCLCASAAHVVDVALRLARGATMVEAFRPIALDLDDIFAKWASLADASGRA